MFHWFKSKAEDYFSIHEKQIIVQAIKQAEKMTSGEIRVFVESKCRFVQAIDRAIELFDSLDMNKTKDRNGVLVYVAIKHKQLSVFADEGIFEKVGAHFWKDKLQEMKTQFSNNHYADGIASIVMSISEALKQHFPYNDSGDQNELSDDIVFGK